MPFVLFLKNNFAKYSHFLLFFFLSLFWFLFINPTAYSPWIITFFDPADYIFLTKHFFEIPQNGILFLPDFNTRWQEFLTLIPFRQIGVGTFYLVLEKIFGANTIIWGPYVLKTLIATSYGIVCQIWHTRIKTIPSWICFIILIFTTTVWVD